MRTKSSVLTKVLLNKFHPGPPLPFLKAIDQAKAKEIAALDLSSDDPSIAIKWPSDAIALTHYSWLAPIIEKMPQGIRLQVIGSLKPPQAAGVSQLLKIAVPQPAPKVVQKYFLNKLYLAWDPKDAAPKEYLPKSPLDELLSFEKSELVTIIDLLGIYDLSDAIRHTVDKNKLTTVYQALSPQRQQFLRQCLHKKGKLAAPKLTIDQWDGKSDSLNQILHRRGLVRFGKILCGQDKQFLWHLVHRLDRGRGKTIEEYYQEREISGVTSLLVQQLFSVINFIKPQALKK